MINGRMLMSTWNWADSATLSGGSWLAALPLANLQTRYLAQAARSADTALASTVVDVTLDTERRIQLIAIVGHNLTSTARIRVTGYSDSGRLSLYSGADTGWTEAVPAYAPTSQLAPEDSNWLSGKPTALNLDRYPRVWFAVLPAAKFVRYWRIEVDDQYNTDGYVDLSRLFVSSIVQPSINFLYGSNFGWDSQTSYTRSRGGVKFYDAQQPYRVAGLQLQNLPADEAYAQFLEMKRLMGKDREFFVSLMPLNLQYRQLVSFQANFEALSRMTFSTYKLHGFDTFELQEAL